MKQADILLIEPPPKSRFGNLRTLGSIGTFKADMAWPPLDLMIIAGYLKKNNIESEILDANSQDRDFNDVLEVYETAALGGGTTFTIRVKDTDRSKFPAAAQVSSGFKNPLFSARLKVVSADANGSGLSVSEEFTLIMCGEEFNEGGYEIRYDNSMKP